MTPSKLRLDSWTPLDTLEPDTPLDDLTPLREVIGAARVVAVGEALHGSSEFYRLRHRLLRLLVEELGFTAVLWESGFPDGLLVDAWLRGATSDLYTVLRQGLTNLMGLCEEMAQLLRWLRSVNDPARRPVRFYGIDLPMSVAGWSRALEPLAELVAPLDAGTSAIVERLAELDRSTFEPLQDEPLEIPGFAAMVRYAALPVETRNEITSLFAELAARMDALQPTFLAATTPELYDLVRHCVHAAAQADLTMRHLAPMAVGDFSTAHINVRDRFMADTVQWALERHEKVVVLAHNGHIQKVPMAFSAGPPPMSSAGTHLARRLGDQYLAIALTCADGHVIGAPMPGDADGGRPGALVLRDLPSLAEGNVEALVAAGTEGAGWLDLRTLGAAEAASLDSASLMRAVDRTLEVRVRDGFDVLVQIPRATLWHSPINARLRDLRTTVG